MSFDLDMEIFGMVSFPKTYSDRSVECLELVEINDKLCLTDRLPWDGKIYGNDCESECDGKILMKIGEQKFGFYELKKKSL